MCDFLAITRCWIINSKFKKLQITFFFKYSPFIYFFCNKKSLEFTQMICTGSAFWHCCMHLSSFEIEKASRQCSIEMSLAVSPLSLDDTASSNPAKKIGCVRCTYSKNTEFSLFFFKPYTVMVIVIITCFHSLCSPVFFLWFRLWSNQSDHFPKSS